jgi:hypothetical protein
MMLKVNTAGKLQFPLLGPNGGLVLPGIEAIVSNALPNVSRC